MFNYRALKHKLFKKPGGNSFQKRSMIVFYKIEHVEAYVE